MKKNYLFSFLLFSFVYNESVSQEIFKGYEHLFTPPLHFTAYQISDTLSIDGRMDEDAWQKSPWSEYFTDIEGDQKPKPAFNTRFKMLWNATHLYIAAELEEPQIWATLTKHDEVIFHDNDFEVFIDPDGDTHHYFEIEINALNTIFDLFLTKPYRNGGGISTAWNTKGLKTAVYIDGTLNKTGDTDKKWSIEMAIPFDALQSGNNTTPPPAKDQHWRINFSRVQWDGDIVDGVYKKKMDPFSGKPLREHNWVWSPQGVINMHYPERWGYLEFGGSTPATESHSQLTLPSEESSKYLWLLYYKQKQYLRKNGKYAKNLAQLELPETLNTSTGIECTLQLASTQAHFVATIVCSRSNTGWQIDHNGKIIPLKQPS
ncbi:MAG TPA: carbohydrate-binding family 9-like protein [Agriterribacter sp.]|nr:carbohydrate-binding family 9-like protein [Agriterribacter sp.]